MSSRIVRSDSGISAEGINWRNSATLPTNPDRPRATPASPSSEDRDREAEARIAAAYQQGRAAGEADAAQRAQQRIDPALSALTSVVAELATLRKKFRADAERDTVKLAIAIAQRVLYRELSTDPEAILGLIKAAFQKCDSRETHRLRLSSSDAQLVQSYRDKLNFPAGLEVAADGSLARGSAVFETSRGDLDVSVNTQLDEIDRGFADILQRRAG